MSFDLDVLAVGLDMDDDPVRAMMQRCRRNPHLVGELDERIVRFYETLRTHYPDHRRLARTRHGRSRRSRSESITSA